MHFGHTYDNYGPLDYLDVGYKSNGLQIGKERASIIGSGPLASAPAASADNQNQFYMSTDFGLCKYVSVFKNEGKDWINCGRPSWIGQLDPTAGYIIHAVYNRATTATAALVSLGTTTVGEIQLRIRLEASNSAIDTTVGGVSVTTTLINYPLSTWGKLRVTVPQTGNYEVKTDIKTASIAGRGTVTSAVDLVLTATNMGLNNMEGSLALFRVCDINGNTIDTLDLNKWDGSSTARFDSGHACTVVAGTPFTELTYSLIPMSVLQCP